MSQETSQPAITFLNMTGDITVTWDAANEAAILAMVEEKMKQKFTFFILKPRFLSILGKKKVAAKTIGEIAAAGSVVIDDDDFQRLEIKQMMGRLNLHDKDVEAAVASGKAHLTKSDEPVDRATVRRATSAQEVVRHQSVAVRRVVGG